MRTSRSPEVVLDPSQLPFLLTADEAAALLRTSRRAIYARAERGLLPGVIYDGRRVLVRRDDLLRSLSERRTASPGGSRR
jgi:excisionase family DNA binding protein